MAARANINNEILVAGTLNCQKIHVSGICHNFRILGRLKSHK